MHANALVYAEPRSDRNVWQVPVDPSAGGENEPHPLVASTRPDSSAVVSPDGSALAFASSRSACLELDLVVVDGFR